MSSFSRLVYQSRGLGWYGGYTVTLYGEVYRNAHDNKTWVGKLESRSFAVGYAIKFGFKTFDAAANWVKKQSRKSREEVVRHISPPSSKPSSN